MQPTRYNKIRNKDLSKTSVWFDAGKNRYDEVLDKLGFWQALDARAVAFTFRYKSWFGAGIIMRILLALLGSNRLEPYPIGNWGSGGPKTMWKGKSDFMQWLKWHLRNPWCDLRKFYLGFAYAIETKTVEKSWGRIHWAKFSKLPFAVPFPEWETRYFTVGWQSRGILSGSL